MNAKQVSGNCKVKNAKCKSQNVDLMTSPIFPGLPVFNFALVTLHFALWHTVRSWANQTVQLVASTTPLISVRRVATVWRMTSIWWVAAGGRMGI